MLDDLYLLRTYREDGSFVPSITDTFTGAAQWPLMAFCYYPQVREQFPEAKPICVFG